jgi:hypothetical protein
MSKDKSGIIQITFDKSAAQLVMDALEVSDCKACGKKITRHSYGGSVKLDDGIAHFHSSLPCLLAFVKEKS